MAKELERKITTRSYPTQQKLLVELEKAAAGNTKVATIMNFAQACCRIVDDDKKWPKPKRTKRSSVNPLQRRAALAVSKTLNLDIGAKTSKIDPTLNKPMREATEAISRGVCIGECNPNRDHTEIKTLRVELIAEMNTKPGIMACGRCSRLIARRTHKKELSWCPTCLDKRIPGERKSKVPCRVCIMIYRLREQGCERRIEDQLKKQQKVRQTHPSNPEWMIEVTRERVDNPPRAMMHNQQRERREEKKPSELEQKQKEKKEKRGEKHKRIGEDERKAKRRQSIKSSEIN